MKGSVFRGFTTNSRRGAIVILLVMAISSASFFTANQYFAEKFAEYKIARANADGFRAFVLAKAGLHGALAALKNVPEEFLYQSGIALNPPPIPLGGGMIYYRLTPEDGKININSLLKTIGDEPNPLAQEILSKLFEQLNLKAIMLSPLIDWMDENNQAMGTGAEIFYYSNLKPPRKIKNGPLYSLSELTSVKGFDRKIVYQSLKPKDYDQNHSTSFLSEEEKLLLNDGDFVLANNITAFIPYSNQYDERINVNAAPYHVLMSLSEYMNRQAVAAILRLRVEKSGYIKDIKDIEALPEFKVKTSENLTLFKELAGQGTEVSSGRIKTKGDIYRIVGVGSYGKSTRRVTVLYDLVNKQTLFYSED